MGKEGVWDVARQERREGHGDFGREGGGGGGAVGDRGVEPEELGDGDADAGECERGAHPGEEGPLEREVVAGDAALVLELDGAVLGDEALVPGYVFFALFA